MKWEYLTTWAEICLNGDLRFSDRKLDDYGRDGWELVNATANIQVIHLFFKRPIENKE